jgi:hypothetical protein
MTPADYSLYYVSAKALMVRLHSLLADKQWVDASKVCDEIMADLIKVRNDASWRNHVEQLRELPHVPIASFPPFE